MIETIILIIIGSIGLLITTRVLTKIIVKTFFEEKNKSIKEQEKN